MASFGVAIMHLVALCSCSLTRIARILPRLQAPVTSCISSAEGAGAPGKGGERGGTCHGCRTASCSPLQPQSDSGFTDCFMRFPRLKQRGDGVRGYMLHACIFQSFATACSRSCILQGAINRLPGRGSQPSSQTTATAIDPSYRSNF